MIETELSILLPMMVVGMIVGSILGIGGCLLVAGMLVTLRARMDRNSSHTKGE